MKKFSLSKLVERFGQSFRRFPLAMLFTLFLACFLIFLNHDGKVGDQLIFFLIFYAATGALLAVAISLLTEDFKRKWLAAVVQVVVHAVWLAVSLYLSKFEHFSIPQMISVSSTVVAIGLAVFIICFYRRSLEVPFWNFSIRTLAGLTASVAICGILTLGLFALVESLKLLFGFHISDKIFGDIASVCMVMLAPGLFMNLIPSGDNKYLYNVQDFSRFSKGVVQYLFLPLLGLYMITLYAYGIKILCQWSLPVGGVSYLVTGSVILMVLLIYITYPIQHLEGNTLFKRVTRLLPVAMFPLLALMTVAIGRRLSDYGVTVSRLYLLVFNVWCYAVCLWLIITRNKRIWLIPVSFALILFLISVGPQSICNITLKQLKGEARQAFSASGFNQFPLTSGQYEKWQKSVDAAKAGSIDDKLDYLKSIYGDESLSDVIADDVLIGRYSADTDTASQKIDDKSYGNDNLIDGIPVIPGYRKMAWIDDKGCEYEQQEKQAILILRENASGKVYRVPVGYDELEALDDDSETVSPKNQFPSVDGNAVFVINGFDYVVSYDGSRKLITLAYSGLLFTK